MKTAFWAAVLAVTALWPARLAGPLDGAPLDTPSQAWVIGALLPIAVWLAPASLTRRPTIVLIVVLFAWKAITAAVLVQDGWCLRFTSPVPVFVGGVTVPHSWDIRADWRAQTPRCSAIMTSAYHELEEFPAWFYNLPPADFQQPAEITERPPFVAPVLELTGYVTVRDQGRLSITAGDDVALTGTIDRRPFDHEQIAAGVALPPGVHAIAIAGQLAKSHWSLVPQWNGADLWRSLPATVAPPRSIDAWIRPWGGYVPAVILLLIVALAAREILVRAADLSALAWTAGATASLVALAFSGYEPLIRTAPVLFTGILALKLPQRLRTDWGGGLLIGVPFLAMLVALHAGDAGVFTWYSIGDDWWMFQRYAYRIYMQGFWLEGGEKTFWFQPLYRWIAGALHLVFGDSSIGEHFWDAAAAVVGAMFAFRVTLLAASFRWAVVAAAVTLLLFTAGPAWYLFGRGLSELTSMGLIYAAALCAIRARDGRDGRDGRAGWAAVAGTLAVLGVFARLNNLPFALAIVVFALPISLPAAAWRRPGVWWRLASRHVVFGVIAAIAVGLLLFTLRTWYYTGVFSMLHGTQGSARSVWQPTGDGESTLQNVVGSFLVVVSMTDPPRFDLRALPIMAGLLTAILAVLGAGRIARAPLTLSAMCLAGFVGALVARGSAYPGRFSIHLIPVAVALCTSVLAGFVRGRLDEPGK